MKIRYILIALALTISVASFGQKINPITKAVLDGYEQLLKENPKDYATLYQKAAQLYNISNYDEALTSILKAIDNTPAKETALRATEFSLLSDIYNELKEYDKALDAVNLALSYEPNNYGNLYKKGNMLLYLNKAEEAIPVFSQMQRLKSRSQEAFFGMAKANAMIGNTNEAERLLKAAEDADRYNYITFCRIGDVYQDLGRNADAATSYLSAFSLADDPSRPLASLIELGKKDFNAVGSTIDYALSKSSNTAPLYFLKANIAYLTGNYNNAYDSFTQLLELPQGKEGAVYSSLAKTCKELNRLQEAETNADLALMKDKSYDNLITKAEVDLANGKASSAFLNAKNAYDLNKTNEALKLMALAACKNSEADDALKYLNEAILNDGGDPELLMLRAYIYNELKNEKKLSEADLNRVSQMHPDDGKGTTYKAIAKALIGKSLDANSIMEDFLKKNDSAEDLYYGAVFYAQTGDIDKGNLLLEASKNKGYQNLFNLEKSEIPYFNILPLRTQNK